MRSFRRTLEFVLPYRWRVIGAVALTLLVTFLQILPPRLFEGAIDHGIKPAVEARAALAEAQALPESPTKAAEVANAQQAVDRAVETDGPRLLMILAGTLAVAVVLRSALQYGLQLLLAWIGHRFCFDLRLAAWRHLHRLSLAYHKQTQTGKIMARVTGDIELIQQLIQGQLVTFLSDIVTIVAVFGMLLYLEWRLAIAIMVLVPFYVLSYMAMLRNIRRLGEEQRRLYDEMVGKLAEKISGIAVVKAFTREDDETESFMHSVKSKFALDMKQVHNNRLLGLCSGVISALGTGIVYAYGGQMVQQGDLTIGQLVAITFYIGYIFNPAVRVVDFNNALQWAVAAMDRVFETLDTRADIVDRPNAQPVSALKNELVFDNVSFRYGQGGEAIQDFTLRVKVGEKIAIVGHSGAGKTTLMNLLMRFYDPTHGRILWDGRDLRDSKLESLRRQMSMVAQENVIFSVSILENIKYGARKATDEQAIEASKAADLHEFVLEMEQGYETKIGEDGVKLSGGQKQRLALARALVTDPSVLILDDVTSALDGETEHRVQQALERVMQGRTTFIIAHRLSSVVSADRIVVLEGGKMVDIGSHAELISRPGVYRDMYREQFKSALGGVAGN